MKEAVTVFPNQPSVGLTEFIRIQKLDVNRAKAVSNGNVIYPRIDGFIRYLFPGDAKFHVTEFSFRMGQKNAAGGLISIDTSLRKIGKSELYLVPDTVVGPLYTD